MSKTGAVVAPEARAAMTREDHERAFATFAASLMADFHRYHDNENASPHEDGVVYRQAAVWLTEDEFETMVAEIEHAVVSRIGKPRDDDRIRRVVSLVVVPDNPRVNADPATG